MSVWMGACPAICRNGGCRGPARAQRVAVLLWGTVGPRLAPRPHGSKDGVAARLQGGACTSAGRWSGAWLHLQP
eukprot:scaffold3293_cov32-Tisochrysis_lutea.AAC.2